MSSLPTLPEEIETDRLILRPPRPGDGAEVVAAMQETFDQLHLWMPWAQRPAGAEEIEETEKNGLLHVERYRLGEEFLLGAYRKNNGAFVLRIGLRPRDRAVPSWMIGYWCRASMQGQGYVTETVRALTAAAFSILQANRIEIALDSLNLPSRRVAERCGYRLEGELRNHERSPGGSLRNTLVFALTPEDYPAPPPHQPFGEKTR